MKNIVLGIVAVLAAVLIGVWFKFGTIDPCGILKEKLRQEAKHEGGIAEALESLVPDTAVDAMITLRYGKQTPGVCLGALLNPKQKRAE